jgi:hypothetical protein
MVLLFSSGFLSQVYITYLLREKLTVYIYDLKLSWQLYAVKSFWAISHISVRLVVNVWRFFIAIISD